MSGGYTTELWLAFILASLATVLLKTFPITVFKGDSIPRIVRDWLEFVPAAVMAALVGPDVFVYNGSFDLSWRNLFLLVSIPTALAAWFTKNYFATIAVGLALIMTARYFGFE